MSENIKKLLEQAPKSLLDEIREESPAMVAFLTSKGYELWVRWAEATEIGLKDNAALAGTLAEREEAHYHLMALRRLRAIPPFLADLARTLDSSPSPDSGAGEVGEAS